MAGNTINMDLKLQDSTGSIKARLNEVKALNKELDRAITTGTKSGSMAAARAGYAPANTTKEGTEYGTARGIAGTGASSRDFANQAQGLGGLVHVYATFAANLFAVGAAFTALKNAADTSNMIEGLNQLGAVSGRNLGTLSKHLVEVTDGAVSLRDAMTATAQATAAGMSSANLVKLAQGAKNASAVLGVSMPDALSRLSRGITKIEPELLDELGVFVRVDKASQEYARSIGKSTSSLTDFEKRTAFANAVLQELDNKFGSMEAKVNPFSKLAASLENVLQSGLSVLNKVIGPLVNLLASSPTALAASITAVGVALLKMALPAITDWKSGLLRQSEAAKEMAAHANETYAAYQHEMTLRHEAELQARVANERKAVTQSLAVVQSAAAGGVKSGKLFNLIQGGVDTPEKQAQAYKLLETQQKRLETLAVNTKNTNISESIRYAARAKSLGEAKVALDSYIKSLETYSIELDNIRLKEEKEDIGNIVRRRNLEKLTTKYRKADILSQVSLDTEELGFFGAVEKLKQKIKGESTDGMGPPQKALEGWNKWSTLVKGSISAAITSIGQFVSAFTDIMFIMTAVTAVFGLFDSVASNANKQLDDFNNSIDKSKEAVDGLDRTVLALSKNKGMTIEGISAISNAYNELGSSLEDSVAKFEQFTTKAGVWDNIKQKFKSIYSGDAASELATNIAKEIGYAFDIAADSPEKEAFQKSIEETFNVKSGKDLINVIGKSVPEAKKLLELFSKYDKELANSVSRMKGLTATIDQAVKISKDLSNSFIPSDNLGKLGSQMLSVVEDMQKSIGNPLEQLKELNAIVDDTSKMALFGKDFAPQLAAVASQVQGINATISTLDARLVQLKQERENLGSAQYTSDAGGNTVLSAEAEYLDSIISKIEARTKELKQEASSDKFSKLFSEAQIEAAKKGGELLSASLQMAFEKGALILEKAKSSFTGAGSAAAEFAVSSKELSLQEQQIRAQIDNTLALKDLTLQFEASGLQDKLKTASEKDRPELEKQLAIVQAQKGLLSSGATYKTAIGLISDKTSSEELKKGAMALMPTLAQTAGAQSQINQLEKTKEANKEAERVKKIYEDLDVLNRTVFSVDKQRLATEQNRLQVLNQIFGGVTAEYDIALSQNKLDQLDVDNKKAIAEYTARINELAGKKGAEKEIQTVVQVEQARIANLGIQKSQEEQNKERLKITDSYLKEKVIRDQVFQKDQQSLQFKDQEVALAKEYLNLQTSMSMITSQEAEEQLKSLDRQSLENSYTLESLRIAKEKADKLADIQQKIDQAKSIPGADISQLEASKVASETYYAAQIANLDAINKKKREIMELDQSLTDRQKAYGDVFKKTFEGMADAMVEFVKTGKLNFADLINSMIADLIRYELRLQYMEMYAAARPGLMNLIGSLFGDTGTPGVSSTSPIATPGATMTVTNLAPLSSAKGNMFDTYGVEAFAKGGAFTNSIVNSPTLFKFAQGTGLMGEAGPEAIMPLKRDSQGNLGVRTNQSDTKVDVVVNNYSTAQATTKETTDSRGNRKVEVTIGSMVSGELQRPNSGLQNTMRAVYGAPPLLTRR